MDERYPPAQCTSTEGVRRNLRQPLAEMTERNVDAACDPLLRTL